MTQPVSDTLAGRTRFRRPGESEAEAERSAFADLARSELPSPGRYLAYTDNDELKLVPLEEGQLRIGRGLTADVRFEDQTVSRTHAIVVVAADEVRVLDDRSLNGVLVNGDRVEIQPLTDGDEITIGRHRLAFVVMSRVAAGSAY